MTEELTEVQLARNCESIAQLARGRSKVLLTSRKSVFRSMWHAQNSFANALKVTGVSSIARFEVMHIATELAGMTAEQMAKAVELRIGIERATDVIRKIRDTYNLEDLARRPLLLDMIITTLPLIREIPQGLSTTSLYEYYITQWVEREQWRGATARYDRLAFAQKLAWLMYRSGMTIFPYKEVTAILTGLVGTIDPSYIESLDYDVRVSSFLRRDQAGNIGFVHQSIMEFFTAKHIFQRLHHADSSVLSEASSQREYVFGPGVDSFLQEMDWQQTALDYLSRVAQEEDPLKRVAATRMLAMLRGRHDT